MKFSVKLGIMGLMGTLLIFSYDYLIRNVTSYAEVASYGTGDAIEKPQSIITEDVIKLAVEIVQKTEGLSPDVGNRLIRELVYQFNKILKPAPENKIESKETNKQRTSSQISRSTSVDNKHDTKKKDLEPLYIITPTFRRPEQMAELTRLSQTLMLVENLHWLVIEDAKMLSPQIARFLSRTGLVFEHLVAPMLKEFENLNESNGRPRGSVCRNRGLEWIRANATNGVFYFADDDNTYHIDLFKEIRRTKKVSMFPVGLCTLFGVSSPIVKNGKFAGFYDSFTAGRQFMVDMAGFAVSVDFFLKRPNSKMPHSRGTQENGFLKSLAPFEPREAELLADNCTRILVWHTQTKENRPSAPLDMTLYNSTNLVLLKQQMV
ncbi:galactosylgalactosylxylosylprotein 3-beta-glucuronosyltransferase P-like [Venturia canescens]|uniref:galactosylgalactosylxylosylprotein 3-beta-glucuronosyltransferase P-like n=1 Tax=Venturia canescens TaxID=32260 RepID=UPI001C9CD4EE|nr:galactosylgalactosylxylosylprotein 3-beta-glucuronosyltransferase P-like [Venturia canescens]